MENEKKKVIKKKVNMRTVRKIDKDGKEYVEGKKGKKDPKKRKKILKICFFVFLALCIIGGGIVFGVISGVIGKTENISKDDLHGMKLTSFVYDINGAEIGSLYDSENRINVEYKDIPTSVVDAIVAIEDERFFKHNGVDIKRTMGAIVTFVLNGGKSNFGGSTITQQLVKNVMEDKESSWTRKIREWYRAMSLEKIATKEEIFASYVSTIYLGDGSYGIQVASQNYFGKPLKDVTLAESAVLAAIIQSPESTNPYKSEEAKKKLLDRQKLVLSQMLKLNKITKEQHDEALKQEIVFKKEVVSLNTSVQSYFVDAVVEAVIEDLQEEKNISRGVALKKLYGDGYKIYTTMDPAVQKVIDNAYNDSKLFYTNKDGTFMQSSMVVMDQSNGNVLGLIGGAGEKKGDLELNRATQTYRQPGSCMKPLGAYGPAFEQGKSSPGAGLDDSPLPKGSWNPGNYYGYFNGYVTAREAIAKSMNLPAVRANQKVDSSFAYNFAKNTGLKSLVPADKNPASLALGGVTNGFTVLEMANAYATIANKGVHIDPKLYTKVVDRNGKEVLLNEKSTAKVVMKESTSYMLTSCLEDVVKSGTAAGYVKRGNVAVAGKTGNTNDDFDQWFCGYSPYYTIACWNGYDKNRAIGARSFGTYPYTSVKLFNTVMTELNKGKQAKQFEKPSSVVSAPLCKVSGLVATDACKKDQRGDQTGTDLVDKSMLPTATCNVHKLVKVCEESGLVANDYCSTKVVEKSFISRDYDPPIKPSDWKYMVPTNKCSIHTSTNKGGSDNKVEVY